MRARRAALHTRRTSRRNFSAVFALAFVGSILVVSVIGVGNLLPFLTSGSPQARLDLMFSPGVSSSLIGQGTGTSTQGANSVGATFESAHGAGLYSGYVYANRVFASAEGGLSKTWLELGILGVALYGVVFWCALGPAVGFLARLDAIGRALVLLALALGIVFLKNHQSLDDPLIQPLFWLVVGGAWGRIRACSRSQLDAVDREAAHFERYKLSVDHSHLG